MFILATSVILYLVVVTLPWTFPLGVFLLLNPWHLLFVTVISVVCSPIITVILNTYLIFFSYWEALLRSVIIKIYGLFVTYAIRMQQSMLLLGNWSSKQFTQVQSRILTLTRMMRMKRRIVVMTPIVITVAVSTFLWMRYRRNNDKVNKRLEAVRKEGLFTLHGFKLIAWSMKVASLSASLLYAGHQFTMRSVALPVMIAGLLESFATLFVEEKPLTARESNSQWMGVLKNHTETVTKESFAKSFVKASDEDDDDELTYFTQLVALRKKCQDLLMDNLDSVGAVGLGGVLGLALFLFVHKRPVFEAILETKKGKNKGRLRGKKSAMTRATKYIIYDDDSIVDILYNGDYVTKGDYINRELADGVYIIVRSDSYGAMWEEEIVVGDDPNEEAVTIINSTIDTMVVPNDNSKKEAVIASNPLYKVSEVQKHIGKIFDEKGNYVQGCVSTAWGLIMNKHSYDKFDSVEFQGKKFAKCKWKPKSLSNVHADLIVLDTSGVDLLPRLKLNVFDEPVAGQKIQVVSAQGTITPGEVLSTTDKEVFINCSTIPGDCGSPYVNSNGKIVGIHFSAGVVGKSNVGISVKDFMALWRASNQPKEKK